MKKYDIVEFKRQGLTSSVLGTILKWFAPYWDGWGWHLAIVSGRVYDGWLILEAVAGGVSINFHSDKELESTTRSYTWLDNPDPTKATKFIYEHLGKQYDVGVYFWTALQYLIRHFFNRRIPRLLDDRYTCWELVSEFCEEMGKPIQTKYDCPMLPDILERLKASASSTGIFPRQ